MKKNTYVFFGLISLILTIWLLGAWQQQPGLDKILSQNGSPELKITEPEKSSKTYKEFIDPDGKLKIQYPSSWFVVENESLFSVLTSKDWKEKYDLKTLFLVQSFEMGKFAQLIVQEGVFDIPTEEIIEEMEKINREQELNMEIIKSDIQNDKAIFEARYLTTNSPNLYSKEEILLIGEKTYLIAFIALEQDWPALSEQADFILNSAQIIKP